MIYVWEKERCV